MLINSPITNGLIKRDFDTATDLLSDGHRHLDDLDVPCPLGTDMSPGLRGDEVEAEVDRSYARWIFLMLRMTSDDAALAVHSSSQMASLRMPSSSWASSVKVAVMDLMRISDTLCRLCSLPSWPMPTPNAETLR